MTASYVANQTTVHLSLQSPNLTTWTKRIARDHKHGCSWCQNIYTFDHWTTVRTWSSGNWKCIWFRPSFAKTLISSSDMGVSEPQLFNKSDLWQHLSGSFIIFMEFYHINHTTKRYANKIIIVGYETLQQGQGIHQAAISYDIIDVWSCDEMYVVSE